MTKAQTHTKRRHVRHYTFAVQQALLMCWHATNAIGSKRLVPYLPEFIAVLERVAHPHLSY